MSIVTYGLGLNADTLDYYSVYGFGVQTLFPIDLIPTNLYIISEELRYMPIYFESRIQTIKPTIRIETIKFEDRVIVVKPKDEEN